jgi:glycosyltransferase involved in cell wall biosynthesis
MSVSKLSEVLVRSGVDVEVMTTTANGKSELDVKAGQSVIVDCVPVTYFKRTTKGNSHLSLTLLNSLIHKIKRNKSKPTSHSYFPIIIHIHAWWNLVSVLSCLIGIIFSQKVILSPRGTLSNYSFNNRNSNIKIVFHRLLGKALLKRCHFHVSTEKEKQDITSLLIPLSISVIPNFVELPINNFNRISDVPNLRSNDDCFKLLFLSRIEEKKGLDILLHALTNVSVPYFLTIAGTGEPKYIRNLQNLALELGLTDKIHWIGQQNKAKKFTLIADHDLMILPSHDESFANVVIESLSVGTPVALSLQVGLAEYITANELGWVYDGKSESLRILIQNIYQNSSDRKRIRQTAPKIIVDDYKVEALLSRYNKLYSQTINHIFNG